MPACSFFPLSSAARCRELGDEPNAACVSVQYQPYPDDTFSFERLARAQGHSHVAGVDEAGRGPLAGPVVAACVVLPPDCDYAVFKDSKQLSARQREGLLQKLHHMTAVIGIGRADTNEIEQYNILQASLLAMKRAVQACLPQHSLPLDFLLVDGTFKVPLPLAQRTLTKGEQRSASIAAASIVAKVSRDRIMVELDHRYPQYGFRQHQGYPTKAHREAIRRHGPCPEHRRTFRGVREYLVQTEPVVATAQSVLWGDS